MPFIIVGDVLKVTETHGEVTFEWMITNFRSLSNLVDNLCHSNVFNFADSQWYLRLCPNGETEYSSRGWLGLHLVRKGSGASKNVCFTFGIKGSAGIVEMTEEINKEFPSDGYMGWGFAKCWSRTRLMNRASTLMPNSALTIICTLKTGDAPISTVEDASRSRELKVIRSMKSILDEGKRADFTLKLGQREWRVHRLILESRCEYFENMFRHDWVENTVGEVTFEDVEEGSLQAILDFIYTGSAENISAGNVCEIYAAAHKFLLDDLKSQCLEWMKKNMCLEIVCEVLVIGDRYDEKELKERAMEYFIREGGEIMDSEEWKRLKKEHSPVVADFLEEAAKRQVKKRRIQ